jgi:signal peptidase I
VNRAGWIIVASGLLTAGTAALARLRLVAVTVEGHSMEPALREGDRVLVLRRGLRGVRRGDVVVVERPSPSARWSNLPPLRWRLDGREWYVKRAAAVPGDPVPDSVASAVGAVPGRIVPARALVVLGDGVSSIDSRRWGYFPAERLLGVVVARLHRAAGAATERAPDG